ncbi:hypothetical protein TNCV_3376071 [Trichonephila clavipes]|nr:hypothetical protein TNCV_3376071 [Trichonephila clavipes]
MVMRHVKDPLSTCLAWGLSAKLKSQRTVLHCQSLSASPWGGNGPSKLTVAIGIRLYGAALKRDARSWGMYYVCSGKTPIHSPIRNKKHFITTDLSSRTLESVRSKRFSVFRFFVRYLDTVSFLKI